LQGKHINIKDTMNAGQLIKELRKHNPSKMVVISGYEGGVDAVDVLLEQPIKLNGNKGRDYYGKHDDQSKHPDCDAILLTTSGH
jgi:hypothetical protein